MEFNAISSTQAQAAIDLRQTYEAWHAADRDSAHQFSGSMRWQSRGGVEYLMRKIGSSEKSLGKRSPETERSYAAFMEGRQTARERLTGLTSALDTQAAIARSIGLGRVPVLVARILRELDQSQVLGHIRIVGTNALYAYEALAGAHFSADALATRDIDLLVDARRQLRIILPEEDQRTVIGLLRRLDRSFAALPGKPYSVANAEGFMVDLICPEASPPWKKQPGAAPLSDGDLSPSPIEGLQWLVNCPEARALVIDERGYPAPIAAPEPRTWLLHKIWLSQRPMREPEKRRRDLEQARATHRLVVENLPQYPFDAMFAETLPPPLREALATLPTQPSGDRDDGGEWEAPKPKW